LVESSLVGDKYTNYGLNFYKRDTSIYK